MAGRPSLYPFVDKMNLMKASFLLAMKGIVDTHTIQYMDYVKVKFYADELVKVLTK